jgi:hypothetical protein
VLVAVNQQMAASADWNVTVCKVPRGAMSMGGFRSAQNAAIQLRRPADFLCARGNLPFPGNFHRSKKNSRPCGSFGNRLNVAREGNFTVWQSCAKACFFCQGNPGADVPDF